MGKDFKISKTSFDGYGRQMGSRKSEKNISTVRNVGQIDIGQRGCGTSVVQHFGSSKFSNKDVRPGTLAHTGGYIDACKCTEIFIHQSLKADNQID